ncbi:MAG: peptidylprolyl isomerase [Lachnospiraceae bacterium]|jgi:foldase protein PrsA|nr:peptidylprolyl isomerase [Lachnospiraceae bacterium]
MKFKKSKKLVFLLLFILVFSIGGCGERDDPEIKVVLTAGFMRDEVFRIETISCMLPEILVYLTTAQNQYESVFGRQVWTVDFDGENLEYHIRETALAQIAQIKTMNLLAVIHDISLDEEEIATMWQAAEIYYSSLNEIEKDLMGVSLDTIKTLYTEYALADKLYHYIIRDINPEISDDEARTITVSHILLRTYALDGTGRKIEFTETTRDNTFRQAQRIRERAVGGEDFERLIMLYSEDEQAVYSFGMNDMEVAFTAAAFQLETDEISEVVETSFGFHIIKCLSTFNREETDNNKKRIVTARREEVFGQEYDRFVATLTRNINVELWEQVTFINNIDVTTKDFFDVYHQVR